MKSKQVQFIERSNIRGFLAILRNWTAILLIVAFSIGANNLGIYLIAVWLIGSFQFCLAEHLVHEASHYNLFKTKAWNNHLQFLFAFPCFKIVEFYREYHVKHHQLLGKENDPLHDEYKFMGFRPESKSLFYLWFIKPLIGVGIIYYLRELQLRPFRIGYKLIVFWCIIVIGFCFSGHLDVLLLYWLVPMWICGSLMYWSEVRDHFNTQSGSRTIINPIENFLNHNAGYHYIHHLYPSIPWYRLPEAHQELAPEGIDIVYDGIFHAYWQMQARQRHQIPLTNDQFPV